MLIKSWFLRGSVCLSLKRPIIFFIKKLRLVPNYKLAIACGSLFACAAFLFTGDMIGNKVGRADAWGLEEVVIDKDTTWEKGEHIIDKSVRIKNGATLTIEKGARISFFMLDHNFAPNITVEDGNIEALGSTGEEIVFTPLGEEDAYYVRIMTRSEDEKVTSFKHVRFEKGGYNPPKILRNKFVNTVYAYFWGIAALMYDSGRVDISDSVFEGSRHLAIQVMFDETAEDSWRKGDFLDVRDSDFEGSSLKVAMEAKVYCETGYEEEYDEETGETSGYFVEGPCATKITLKDNWYDSKNGPTANSNPTGDGEAVIGPVDIAGWRSSKDKSCASCASNVLFLPGLEASRLYDDEEKLWEPANNGDVEKLYLDADGKSIKKDVRVKEGDVLDNTPVGSGIYGEFIRQMDELESGGLINDWRPVAYDWRMSLDEIVSSTSLADALRNLAENSKTKKVTIVAHSNGGLLAKELMIELGEEESAKLIDKVILVAVPQIGTPDAIAAMLHGYKQNVFPVLSKSTARGLAVNMSSVYNLLPAGEYFSTVQTPIINFETEAFAEWNGRYAKEVDSRDELDFFLLDNFRRVLAPSSELDMPAILNGYLLDKARRTQESLSEWNIPSGIRVIQIAGWGVDKTVGRINYEVDHDDYCDGDLCYSGVDILEPEIDSTIDGDGTVVTPSALWLDNAERYWVNVRTYNRDNPFNTAFGFFNREHKNILEIKELLSFIRDNLTLNTKPISEYTYLSTEVPPSDNIKRLQYSLHSPLSLELYDEQGRRTGLSQEGEVQEQIPGTYYSEIGDVKYIFSDTDFPNTLKMKGYGEGNFTFSVKEYDGDDKSGEITFKDMPVTENTEVSFSIPDGLESASALEIDLDGDGNVDYSLGPKIGEDVTFDSIAPETSVVLDGALGENGWHVGDVRASLSAVDNAGGSGIRETEYSLDNGSTWKTYQGPIDFSKEGIFEILYFSTDNQGNKEDIKNVSVKIDKTYPEAKVVFDEKSQKLEISGMDNLSQNVWVNLQEEQIYPEKEIPKKKGVKGFFEMLFKQKEKRVRIIANLKDQAGHVTELLLEKKRDRNGFLDLSLISVSYGDEKLEFADNRLQYKWLLNRRSGKYSIFAAHIRTSTGRMEAHYLPKSNQTLIMEGPTELPDDEQDNIGKRRILKRFPGMVVPGLNIEKGQLKVIY